MTLPDPVVTQGQVREVIATELKRLATHMIANAYSGRSVDEWILTNLKDYTEGRV